MRARRLLLNLVVGAGLLLAVEGWCSLGDKLPKYRISPLLGHDLLPGYVGKRERVNLHGLRGAELRPRVPERLRILAMGGSTTWGHKLADDETWPVALERELTARTGRDIEVLNGGVSGWGFEHIGTALRTEYLEAFRPDVVLGFEGWNLPLMEASEPIRIMRAEIVESTRRDGLHRSALYRALKRTLTEWRQAPNPETADPRPDAELQATRERHYPRIFSDMARQCSEHGARLYLIGYPGLAQRAPAAGGGARDLYEENLRDYLGQERDLDTLVGWAHDQYRAGVGAVIAAAGPAGIEVLDVAGRMEAELPPGEADLAWAGYFRDHLHLTAQGNAAIGRALAELLIERQALPPPPQPPPP